MQFSLKVTHEMEIIPTIMQWIPHIKVLEPEWLRNKVVQRVTEYLN
jgi:predicted DNA-binding transcriptional regulator YafY